MLNVSVFCFLASYAVALVLELVRQRMDSPASRVGMLAFAAAGLVAHTMYLLLRASQTHLPPLLSSAHDWLLVLAWLIVVIYFGLSIRQRGLAMGIVVLPAVLAIVTSSYFVTMAPSQLMIDFRGVAMLHASSLVFGIGAIVFGLAFSLLFLWQHWRLKRGALSSPGNGLPSLEALARMNRWSMLVAVPLISIGMLTGIGLALGSAEQPRSMTWSDPVVLGGLVSWGLMCFLLIRLMSQHRSMGRDVAWLTIASCSFLLVTIVGLQMITAAMGSKTVHGLAKPIASQPARETGGAQ